METEITKPNETLYEVWARRNPSFEKHFKEELFTVFTDYGIGANAATISKGKVFGAGYELCIYAFFVGLYSKERLPLAGETMALGQPIRYWGNLEQRKGRKPYSQLREYIFAALIAETEGIDLIKLEKGEISDVEVVNMLLDTMEEYINYGLHYIKEKLDENPNYFFRNTAFLDVILDLVDKKNNDDVEELV